MNQPFVGRREELDALFGLVQQACRTRGPGAAVVTGEPGSGKTRLLEEVLSRRGSPPSVRVIGFEPSQPIPFAAAGGLLRQLTRTPEHGARLEALAFGGHGSGARDALRIFEAAHRARAALGPLLVAIDDLQWLDAQSLALVHYLLRAAESAAQPLCVIAFARPSAAATALRSSVETETPAGRRVVLELGPLPLRDGLALVRSIDGGLDEATVRGLWRQARGSPFWLEALARDRRPGRPMSLIDRRLRGLGSDAGTLLAALAVAARPLLIDDIAEILRWPGDRVRQAARELIASGLALDAASGLALAHDLIREAVISGLPPGTRRRLHADLAAWLEAGAGDDLRALREALQHRQAAGLPVAELAARLVTSPQRRLIDGEGLRSLASIADALERGIPEHVRLDAELGELAAELGELELAVDRWARVGELTTDPSTRQRSELELARSLYRLGRGNDALRHLERARGAAPVAPTTSVEIGALQADVELWLGHDTAAGSRTAARALAAAEAMAAAAGGIDALAPAARRAYQGALEAAIDAALQEERADDVLRLSEMSVLAALGLDEESYLSALTRSAFALHPLGHAREAQDRYRQSWDVARQLILPRVIVEAGQGLARSLRDLGSLAEALAVAQETVELEARAGSILRRWGSARSILHLIQLSAGDTTSALRELQHDAEIEANPHYRLALHQRIGIWKARSGGSRMKAEVELELEAARAVSDVARCPRCAAELLVVSAELLARIGRTEEARRELAAWERRAMPSYPQRELWRLRAQAAIAMAAGEAGAATLLAQLAMELERLGLVEDQLWAQLDLGRCLARIDRDRAVVALSAAAALAERIGARAQGRLAAQELRRLGIRAWRRGRATPGDGLGRLSSREREVVRLVAGGGSNREIAESLLISPKTVERHITNALAKLGLRNRTELAGLVRSAEVAEVRDSPDD